MRKLLEEYIRENAVRLPNKTAIIAPDGMLTYSQLYSLANGYASFLKKNGLQRQEIVLIKAAQTREYVVFYFAVHLAGGVVCSLEETIPAAEMVKVAERVGARFIVSSDLCSLSRAKQWTVLPREILANAESCVSCEENSFPNREDLADIMFTTGTTGVSKGVALTHETLAATLENLTYGCGYQESTVMVAASPLNHAHAIRHLYTSLANGSTFYLLNGMKNLKNFYQALDYPCEKVSCWLPPAAVRMLFMLSGNKLGEYADKIDFVEISTQAFPEPDKEKLCQLLPKSRLLNCYGSSESGVVCMYDFQKHPEKKGCVGQATQNSTIRIVDDNRNEIVSSRERPGLISCVGDMNMKGYVNAPELTREVLVDGVVYTNDIGYMDEEGFVYVLGRQGDVINVGGLKVAPTEVEDAALAFEGIEDCVCIPAKHPISGSVPKLLVVMREGEVFQAKAIREFLLTRLEGYKVPTAYEQVDAVKRTYNGKLDRKALQQMWQETGDQLLMNDTIHSLLERRSIRDFTQQPITRAHLELILQTGIYAPSGRNMQTWRFTVLHDSENIEKLKSATAQVAKEKKVYFYGFNNPQAVILVSNDRRNNYAVQDSSCAAQNMMLAAHSLGIGSVWINALATICDEPEIRQMLDEYGVPKQHIIYAAIAMGYPQTEGKLLAKKQDVIHWVDDNE